MIDKSDNVTKDIFDGADLKWTEEDMKDVPTFIQGQWFDTGIRVPNRWYNKLWRKWRTLFVRE